MPVVYIKHELPSLWVGTSTREVLEQIAYAGRTAAKILEPDSEFEGLRLDQPVTDVQLRPGAVVLRFGRHDHHLWARESVLAKVTADFSTVEEE